jgi:uncharacterized protein YggU (UPF0235/DUF167 family)
MTRLRLRVSPGGKRSSVVGRHGEAWKVRVAAAPERGAANDAVVDLLASSLSVERGDRALGAGRAARDKVVEIDGLAPEDVRRRLAEASSR